MNKPVNTTKTTAWNMPLLADQAQKLRTDITHHNNRLNETKGDYTPAGLEKLREQRTAPLRERIQELTTTATQWKDAATQKTRTIRANQFPTAEPGTTAALHAEMQMARILGRGNINSEHTQQFFDMEPSPTRTLLIEELQARGVISADTIEANLLNTCEEYREAKSTAETSQTAHATFTNQLNALNSAIANGHEEPGSTVWHDIDMNKIPGASTAYDVETPTTYWDMPTSQFGIRD
ncbi:hypothetical protein ACUY3M_03450 [Corynebacterium suicordis]